MPYFTDETKFTLPVTSAGIKEDTTDGWEEYAIEDGYSLQRRETKSDSKCLIQWRKVRIK